jgi:hypothetical protein
VHDADAACVQLRLRPPLPKPGLDLQGLDPEAMSAPLCAKVAGFSLHASRVVDEWDREGLERP